MVGNDTIHTVTRKEHDCIGYMDVPKDVYWGIHTQRALGNFTVSRIADSTHPQLMRAYATVKRACAEANDELGLIDHDKARLIVAACHDVENGELADQFPVDVLQGGAGTSTNMNMNEVIANRALELGGPMGVKRAGIEDVKDWAKSNGLRAGRIIDDMFKAIGEQTVTVPGTLMAETIIPSIAHDIKTIRDRRREVGRQVEKLLEDHPLLTVLTSMPGIGVRTASNILLGIGGDIANFKSSAHLAAYAGISPVTGQSGTSIKGERPSRRGNKRLKNALWQTAFVASTKHPPSVAYYKRKREQGKHHNAAIICLARRRCDVIYSMLKNGTLYQEPALVA